MTSRNATANEHNLVYGESAHELLRALSKNRGQTTASGMVEIDLTLSSEEASPLIRALMRAEARLLLDEAAAFGPDTALRTPEERGCDAFVEIVTSLSNALG
ncbi:MAG: hypothetical protein R2733_03650 [Acidimicrobiales bacterium]